MSSVTEELIRICGSLPEAQRNEVADFARFLAARRDDERWKSLVAYPKAHPKLDAFLRESANEGESPLDLGCL